MGSWGIFYPGGGGEVEERVQKTSSQTIMDCWERLKARAVDLEEKQDGPKTPKRKEAQMTVGGLEQKTVGGDDKRMKCVNISIIYLYLTLIIIFSPLFNLIYLFIIFISPHLPFINIYCSQSKKNAKNSIYNSNSRFSLFFSAPYSVGDDHQNAGLVQYI